MRRFVLILMMASVWVSGSAQEKKTLQDRIGLWKSDMAEFNERARGRRAEESVMDTLAWLQAEKALADSSFVIEADAVTFKYGNRAMVSSSTNFVSLDKGRAVVQISPGISASGPNGVGGITLEGSASDILVKKDKKGNLIYRMSVYGRGINSSVRIMMTPGSPRASVEVSPDFHSHTVRLEGVLVPYGSSGVIEGMSL